MPSGMEWFAGMAARPRVCKRGRMGLFSGLFDPFMLSRRKAVAAAVAQPSVGNKGQTFRVVSTGIATALQDLVLEFTDGAPGWWAVALKLPGFNARAYAYTGKRELAASMLKLSLPAVTRGEVFVLPDNRILAVAKLPASVSCEDFIAALCDTLRVPDMEGVPATKVYDLHTVHAEFAQICGEIRHALLEQEKGETMQNRFNVQELTEFSLTDGQLRKRRERDEMSTLIIEDDPSTAALLVHLIGRNSHVVSAADAVSGVKEYRQMVPDLVFLDIGLPDMNGLELLKKLVGGDNAACVVMLTANAYRHNLDMATRWGAQGFIAKPFRRERLNYYLNLAQRLKAESKMLEAPGHALR